MANYETGKAPGTNGNGTQAQTAKPSTPAPCDHEYCRGYNDAIAGVIHVINELDLPNLPGYPEFNEALMARDRFAIRKTVESIFSKLQTGEISIVAVSGQ